jgi:hypothetical protein
MFENIIIAPYYEDAAADDFCREIAKQMSKGDHLIIVDDGSTKFKFDESLLHKNRISGIVLRLSRNVGHQAALVVGVDYALKSFDFKTLSILDSDGEDNPAHIVELLNELRTKNLDMVVAKRLSRVESMKFKAFYLVYKLIFRMLVGKNIGFGNFMVMTKSAARRLLTMPEVQLHLAASVMASNQNIGHVYLDRGKRYQGQSKMNLVSLTLHGLKSIMVFSDQVLVRITLFSILFAVLVLIAMFIMTWMKVIGTAIPGWYSTGGGILIVLFFQVGFLALMTLLISGKVNNRSFLTPDWSKLILSISKSNFGVNDRSKNDDSNTQ